jgi:hypothetical protein
MILGCICDGSKIKTETGNYIQAYSGSFYSKKHGQNAKNRESF